MNLDSMRPALRAYLECALWASVDDDGNPLDNGRDASDFDHGAVFDANTELLVFELVCAADIAETGMSADQLGHDLWLTRNGHGVGFWDRRYGAAGDRLTDAAHAMGECNAYIGDDGLAYFERG